MHNHSFPSQIERKLRQVILTDLIHPKFGKLYKIHFELLLNWLRLLMGEMKLSPSEQKVLLSAAYGYHWGCGNLFDVGHAHSEKTLEHNSQCYKLAASKIERFLSYHFSKLYAQQELLLIAKILEEQVRLGKDNNNNLAYLLWETSVLAWFELFLEKDSKELGKKEIKIINKLEHSYFLDQEKKFINQVSKQAFSSLLN